MRLRRASSTLLATLQDRVDPEAGRHRSAGRQTLARLTREIDEAQNHPLAGAWPALREHVESAMKVFGRGNDSRAGPRPAERSVQEPRDSDLLSPETPMGWVFHGERP